MASLRIKDLNPSLFHHRFIIKAQRPPQLPGAAQEQEKESKNEREKSEEFENSFNFDSVIVADDDSDSEEFVNIVVQELEEQIGKDDENVRKILRKVSESARRSKLD